jgi:molybdopterin/thiamine biosynthesis adenylyltransferase
MSSFHSRQEWFLSQDSIKDLNILVVGTGAIGRNVASCVSRLGPKSITIVDHDIIEEHNISPQNWRAEDCGQNKVDILAREILSQCSNIDVVPIAKRWTPNAVKTKNFDAVWATVDNIEVRRGIYKYYRDKAKMFFDIRIGGPLAQVFTIEDLESIDDENDWYASTFFPQAEAANFGCIQPMTNFLANIATGISVNQFTNIVNGKKWPVHKMLTYDTITSAISVEDPVSYFKDL